MLFTTSIVVLSAAGALGSPVIEARTWTHPDGHLQVRGIGNQGDGFYSAEFNKDGKADVKFIPWAELNHTAMTVVEIEARSELDLAARDVGLVKRAGTTCSGMWGISDPDNAEEAARQLARNEDQKQQTKDHWGWVHRNGATAYACNYQTNWLTYGLIWDMTQVVIDRCGRNVWGYDRRTNGGGAADLAVGRCPTGDNFCSDGFKG